MDQPILSLRLMARPPTIDRDLGSTRHALTFRQRHAKPAPALVPPLPRAIDRKSKRRADQESRQSSNRRLRVRLLSIMAWHFLSLGKVAVCNLPSAEVWLNQLFARNTASTRSQPRSTIETSLRRLHRRSGFQPGRLPIRTSRTGRSRGCEFSCAETSGGRD